ncbi:MAG: phosphoribosylglycinamide formyltransferase [Xanthomonadales bacterium]|nr:phosphoribosylglycinamide formyltransferase [Xanthomonadales bacterium]
MTALRCLVLLSGHGSNLATMIAARDSGRLPLDICAVISNRSTAPGLDIARQADIPAIFVDPANHPDRQDYDRQLSRLIQEWQPGLIVLAGFMRILSAELVNSYPGRMINLHPSLLPKYTGLDTYNRALTAGDSHYGASIHFVTPELDAGALISQAVLAIEPGDSADIMADRLQPIEHQLLVASLELFSQHTVELIDDMLHIDGKLHEKPLPLATDGHLALTSGLDQRSQSE